jgi:predicted nuclease of predicted toxin-antitoxin system
MAKQIRFHLDASVPLFAELARALRKRGVDVTTANEVGLRTGSDPDHFAFCKQEQRVRFTNDQDFLAIASQDSDHAGIFYCRQHKHSLGDLIYMLNLYWETYEPHELHGKVEYL